MISRQGNPIFQQLPEAEQKEIKKRTALVRRSAKRRMISALHSRNAVAEIEQLPELDETLHIICRGNFPLWSIVPATLKMTGAKIERLVIATLGFSTSNATDLLALFGAGQIQSVNIVASVFFERQNPAEWQIMRDGLIERGQRIAALRAHAKIIGMKMTNGSMYAVESSANLRSCRNIEQICITASRELYEFHESWIKEVCAASHN